jgi:hypothetical protein
MATTGNNSAIANSIKSSQFAVFTSRRPVTASNPSAYVSTFLLAGDCRTTNLTSDLSCL